LHNVQERLAKLGSLEPTPFAITLWAYDGHHLNPRAFSKIPIELERKMVLIDIKVIDTPLDYNILLGCSYMYVMKVVASSMFENMIFPHNGKVTHK
jgi:hypothetical protein